MSDIKLFKVSNNAAQELQGASIAVEKTLQTLIEQHLEAFLGVRFLKTEQATGKTHGGRIDTLGIDENGSPVIVEYKRALNENVINQGLFYLDWLMDHKAEFELLVMKKLGDKVAASIEWSAPRLLCIASDFTRYDEHAVQQINRNIELIRYRRYGDELILFELVNAASPTAQADIAISPSENGQKHKGVIQYKTAPELLEQSPSDVQDRFEALKAFLLALGDDVQLKILKYYFAFRRIKNFVCVEVHPQTKRIMLFVKVDPSNINLEEGFTRDVRNVGHYGTGDLEITVQTDEDLERAKALLLKSYEVS